jgi:hypothetical protein
MGNWKNIFEVSLQHYAKNAIIKNNTILVQHLSEICISDNPKFEDTYSTRSQGYCYLFDALKQIDKSSTVMACNIKSMMTRLYNEHTLQVNKDNDLTDEELLEPFPNMEESILGENIDSSSTDSDDSDDSDYYDSTLNYPCIII